jgi:hypothetical protein
MFNQSRQDQAPFRQAGLVGLNQYMSMLGLPTSSVTNTADDTGVKVGARYAGTGGGTASNPLSANDLAYLKANPDVAATQFSSNPYQHYLQYGAAEGRQWPGSTASSAPAQTQQDAFAAFRSMPGY